MKKVLCLVGLLAFAVSGCSSKPSTTAQLSSSESLQTVAAQSVSGVSSDEKDSQEVAPGKLVAAQAKTATLKAKFLLDGDVPKAQKVNNGGRDPFCAALNIMSEKMVIGKDGAIQNLAVYLDTRRTKIDLPDVPVDEDAKIVLDNKGCVFVPHMIVARTGQTVTVKNSDGCGHNANFNFLVNPGVNFLVPAGGEKKLKLEAAEPAPIPVECNVHPWMRSYIIITDHPYVGVTDDSGEMTIENLPVGEVTFKIWHENSVKSLSEGTVNGKKEKWRSGRMEIDLKPGVNDLGTIKIPLELFNK